MFLASGVVASVHATSSSVIRTKLDRFIGFLRGNEFSNEDAVIPLGATENGRFSSP
jgi:hypothetical protein